MANTTLVAVGVVLLLLSFTVGFFSFLFYPLLILGILLMVLGAVLSPSLSERMKRLEERSGLSFGDSAAYRTILRRLYDLEDRVSRLGGEKQPTRPAVPLRVTELPAAQAREDQVKAEAAAPPEVPPAPLASEEERGPRDEKPMAEGVPPWERVLGEKWLQWVGLAILATALITLGGLAFEQMTAGQKVATIFAASIAVGLLGEYLHRRGYRSYALGMVGGGFAIAYIAALSAFYLFQILPIASIGATLWTVTVVNALATARYRSPELAGQAMVASLVWTVLLRLETLTGGDAALLLVGVYALFALLILYHRHWILVLLGYGLMIASALALSPLLAPLTAVPLFAAIGFLALFLGLQRYLTWVSFPEIPYATVGGVILLLFASGGLIALQGALTPLNAALSLSALTAMALWFDREALEGDMRIVFILLTALLSLVFFLFRPSEWALLPPLVALAGYTAVVHREFHAHIVSGIALFAAYRLSQDTLVSLSTPIAIAGLSALLYGLIAVTLILDRRYLPKVASIGAGLAPLIPAFAFFEPVPYPILVPGLLGAVVLASHRTGSALQSTALFGGFYLFVLLSGSLLGVPPLWIWSLLLAGMATEGVLLGWSRLDLPYDLPPLAPWVAAIGFPLAIGIPQVTTQLLLAGSLLAVAILTGLPKALSRTIPRLSLATLSLVHVLVIRTILATSLSAADGLTLVFFSMIPLAVFALWYVVELLRPRTTVLATPVGNLQLQPLPLVLSVLALPLVLGGPPLYLLPPLLLVGLAYGRADFLTYHVNALLAVILFSVYLSTVDLGTLPVAVLAGVGMGASALGWELRNQRLLSTPTMLLAGAYVFVGATVAFGGDVGTTLAWALAGGSLLLYGLVFQDRRVRYGGFGAVFAAVGKIFVADLVGVPIAIRIAALVVVAGLLLLVSFTYARLGRKQASAPKERKAE